MGEQTTSLPFPIPILPEHTLTTLQMMGEQTTSLPFPIPILLESVLTTLQHVMGEYTTSKIMF